MIHDAIKKLFVAVIGVLSCQILCAQHGYQLDSVVSIWSHYDTRIEVAQQWYDSENRLLIWQNEVRGADSVRDEGARHAVRYDERGNELESIDSHWNAVKGMWVEREKRTRTYDNNDRMLSYAEYEMRNGKWNGLARVDHVFEDSVSRTTEYRGQAGDWVPVYQNVGLFSKNGNDMLTVDYQWDTVSGDWAYWMKTENTFRQDTLLEESALYRWKDGAWTNNEKTEYIYVPDSDKISDRIVYAGTGDGWKNKYYLQIDHYVAVRREEAFYWSDEEDKWKPESFKEIYMDRYGRETDFVLFLWDEESVEYKRHAQGMTVYDAQDKVILVQEVRYDKGKISEGVQMVFDIDKDGNLYREAYYSLVNKIWVEQTAREFTFNKDIVLQDEYGNTCVYDRGNIGYVNSEKNKHAIESIHSYRYMDGEKILQEESRYYYGPTQID